MRNPLNINNQKYFEQTHPRWMNHHFTTTFLFLSYMFYTPLVNIMDFSGTRHKKEPVRRGLAKGSFRHCKEGPSNIIRD
jgi:hypothetical protein